MMQPCPEVRTGLAEGSRDSDRERPEFCGHRVNWLFLRKKGATRLDILGPGLSVRGTGATG